MVEEACGRPKEADGPGADGRVWRKPSAVLSDGPVGVMGGARGWLEWAMFWISAVAVVVVLILFPSF